MILREYFDYLKDNTSYDDSIASDRLKMLATAKRVLKKLAKKFHLEATEASNTLTTVAAQHTYSLDPRAFKITNFRETTDQVPLQMLSRHDFEEQYPYPASTETGQPDTFIPMERLRVMNQPSAASTIILTDVGTEASNVYVTIKGIANGIFVSERLTLSAGINPTQTSTNSYTKLISISKGTSTGTITAKSNTSTITNVILGPTEYEREYWFVRLHKIPDDAYTFEYSFQVVPWDLVNDEDPIMLPDMYLDGFLSESASDILFKQGDEKFAAFKQEGLTALSDEVESQESTPKNLMTFGFAE
jgi:hypothetical protein